MKDYYKIMNVPYDASAEDIRRAYHHFAKKYHPDKNGGEAAAVMFLDIQEAYHTLSDKQRRRDFHLRTHYPLPRAKRTGSEITTESILQQCHLLQTKLQNSNRHSINPVLISHSIEDILSEKKIRIMLSEGKTRLTEEVVARLLPVMQLLPYRLVIPQTGKLLRLATHNAALQEQIIAFGNRKRKFRYWEKYNLIIILATTLLLCALIVLLSD